MSLHTSLVEGALKKVRQTLLSSISAQEEGLSDSKTLEHLKRGHPSLDELASQGFILVKPDWNARLWLLHMLADRRGWFYRKCFKLLYYVVLKRLVKQGSWWGGYLVWRAGMKAN